MATTDSNGTASARGTSTSGANDEWAAHAVASMRGVAEIIDDIGTLKVGATNPDVENLLKLANDQAATIAENVSHGHWGPDSTREANFSLMSILLAASRVDEDCPAAVRRLVFFARELANKLDDDFLEPLEGRGHPPAAPFGSDAGAREEDESARRWAMTDAPGEYGQRGLIARRAGCAISDLAMALTQLLETDRTAEITLARRIEALSGVVISAAEEAGANLGELEASLGEAP